LAYDRTLIQIRERSFLDLLDLAMVVVRQRPVTLGLAALVGSLPFAALNWWLINEDRTSAGWLPFLIGMEVPWATAPLTVVLGGLMFEQRPTAGNVFRTLARSFFPMFVYQFLLRGVLIITTFLYVIIPTRKAFFNEVILLERPRWLTASARTSALCEQRGGDLFGQWLAQCLFGTLFVLAFWLGSTTLTQALVSSELTWTPTWNDLLGIRFHFALWLAIEFFAVARFFTYIDQRIRLEGWEVSLRLRSVGQAMEGVGRW
jgi:hypothetical protein